VWLLAAVAILHDGATNLVGAIRDVDGDRASNCLTVPVVYGVPRSVDIASAMAAASCGLSLVTLLVVRPYRVAVVLFAAAAALATGVYGQLLLKRRRLIRPEALNAHKWLVAERLILMSAFTACRAPRLAVVALSSSLPASMILQLKMRDRHERQAAEHAVG
jgi:4-hydroxybenzoate polyprenyltransferase/geranylgeranylglycerol-phosphate geranylgeranyltransferase